MNSPRRLILSFAATALLALAAVPASASANTVVGPSPLTFPQREEQSTSDPQLVTVTIVCNAFNGMTNQCNSLDSFTRNPQFSGTNPGDFFADPGGTCPASFTLTTGPVFQCTIPIRFRPAAPGDRTANFLAGTATGGGPNPIVVQGSAVAKPVTPTVTPPPAKKKCKKGKKKKKCKKKKK